jgi:hypothetical protein
MCRRAWKETLGSFRVLHAIRQARLTACGLIILPSMSLRTSVVSSGLPIKVENRFGCRPAAVMAKHRHRLGPLQWPQTHYKAADNWHQRELALIERHVKPLLPTEEN